MPLIAWGIVGVAGLFGLGYAADKTGEAAEGTARLAKWAVAGAGVYLAYRVAKGSGAVK